MCDQIKLIENYFSNGMTIAKISQLTGRSRRWISRELKNLGYKVIPINKIKHFNEKMFDQIDSEEKAYWLGFLFADGNVGKNDYSISINLQLEDIEHLKKFNKFLNYDYDNIKMYTGNHSVYCKFYCKNKHMHSKLLEYGCIPNKSCVMEFPKEILNSEYFWDFVRGYFDGDGCLTYDKRAGFREPRCSFSCGSKAFIEVLSKELHQRGIGNKISLIKNTYILKIGDKKWDTNAKFLSIIYKNSSIYLERKYNKFLNYRGRLVE